MTLKTAIWLCFATVWLPMIAVADVYIWVDKDGITHITNVDPSDQRFDRVQRGCETRPGGCGGRRQSASYKPLKPFSRTAYDHIIRDTASAYRVDEDLVRAVIHVESAYNPRALSNKGAQGLMQLMPATAARFGVQNAFDATDNIAGGVRYLKHLIGMFNNDLRLVLAAYNAGENAVTRYNGIPPYPETQQYVEKVSQAFNIYRKM
jgi:hypothetical protein